MATKVISLPGGMEFAAFYYPELLSSLLAFLRANRDRIGLTDENDFEVHVQLLRSFALMGHLSNTKLDTVATEMFVDSAGLLESLKRIFRLVGIELDSASPATAELVAQLSEVTSVDLTDFIPGLAEFSTDAVPPIVYEANEDGEDLNRTDQVKHVFAVEASTFNATGEFNFNSPDVLIDQTFPMPADVVGKLVFVKAQDNKVNFGLFRVTERISADEIRLVTEPGGDAASFKSETGVEWYLLDYSVDHAAKANDSAPTETFTPWAAVPSTEAAFYVCHQHVMPTQVDLDLQTPGDSFKGVWEYYDGLRSAFNPKTVTFSSPTLEFDCEALLGTEDRSGAQVRITYLQTGASKTITSIFSGGKNVVQTTDLFGQVNPSTDPEDYFVSADWVPFSNVDDGTTAATFQMAQSGAASWDLPQTRVRSWNKAQLNNQTTGFWFRFRVVESNPGTTPVINRVQIDQGDQYILFSVLQGETVGPVVFGSSTGQPNQRFKLADTPFLDGSQLVEVDEGGVGGFIEYTKVDSFLDSSATSRHYKLQVNAKDEAEIIFGDGIRGKIPPLGLSNLRATHRIGGDEDGNVGADQIVVNADGVGGIRDLFNPRPARGWRVKEGGDETDFERVKRDKPAEVSIRNTASRPQDAEYLAVRDFTDADGIKPVARAFAVEEGFGIKTMKLLVVGDGGGSLTAAQLKALDLYFNGNRHARPPVEGISQMNTKIIPVNFEPTTISIEATVIWSNGSAEAIRNQLIAFLTPTSVEDDGTTFVWNFGAQVSYSRIHSLIHEVDPTIEDVSVLRLKKGAGSFVETSIDLGQNELPITTGASIAITILEP